MTYEAQAQEQELDETKPAHRAVSWHYYQPTSYYGADLTVVEVVQRLKHGEILVPHCQRTFVWDIEAASRFIESLLLELPVPGIFLAQEQVNHNNHQQYLILDGQQRLSSLLFFYEGIFNPSPPKKRPRPFKLMGVLPKYAGQTYNDLSWRDRNNLDNALLHATIVDADFLTGDDTSIYQIYERLNQGGQHLQPQEVRCVVYHGKLIDLAVELNDYPHWRSIIGKKDQHLKDQELLLRFWAMYFSDQVYKPPMSEFINVFTKTHRNPNNRFLEEAKGAFIAAIDTFYKALGSTVFHHQEHLNAAIFESMMYGLAQRLKHKPMPHNRAIVKVYESLLADLEYTKAVTQETANATTWVALRLQKAKELFATI